MIKAKFCEFIVALGLVAPLQANAQSLPPEVEAVRNYVLTNDYPEVFSGQRYRVKIENIIVADLDGDGTPEVIAHVKPHFRQSPTIIIFKVSKDLHVQRVMEGLAPGPLQSVSGNYLDSHTLGEGADFQVVMKPEYGAGNGLVQGLVKSQKGSLVIYKNFAHLDGREGPPTYIDLSAAILPAGINTCEDFEFSDIDQVEVTSRFSTDGRKVIAAHLGKKIYAIRIERFLPDGLLEKSVTVQEL
jgi:hypothetical protein